MTKLRRDVSLLVEPTRAMQRQIADISRDTVAQLFRDRHQRLSADELLAGGFIDSIEVDPTNDPTPMVDIELGDMVVVLPPSAWQNARARGLDHLDVLSFTPAEVWQQLRSLGETLGLSELTLSGLWGDRSSGRSPHRAGRGVDLSAAVGPGGRLSFRTEQSGSRRDPPAMIEALLTWARLRPEQVTQVLCPWWIWTADGVDRANTSSNARERGHLDHLHLTIAPTRVSLGGTP